ncbi:hypothetical protein ACMA110817_29970 [Achromobacter marplatensis]
MTPPIIRPLTSTVLPEKADASINVEPRPPFRRASLKVPCRVFTRVGFATPVASGVPSVAYTPVNWALVSVKFHSPFSLTVLLSDPACAHRSFAPW